MESTATRRRPIALSVAGSDSGGGAGIQADLKTFHAFGVYGTSVLTATTAQNTRGVADVHIIPTAHVVAQLDALASDLPPSAFKSGMLATAEIAGALADAVVRHGWSNYVLDPVMVATSGDRLLDSGAEDAIRTRLLPHATLVTPNVPEAEVLTGAPIRDVADLEAAGRTLIDKGANAALMKGGHLNEGDEVLVDLLVLRRDVIRLTHPRVHHGNTHGTGCTLAAAVVAGLALGHPLETAVREAVGFVARAIRSAPELGAGNGPINHFAPVPDWSD